MADPLLIPFDIADQGIRAMARWKVADIDEALWRHLSLDRRGELLRERKQLQDRIDEINSAQALGFESVAEMRSHADWLAGLAQYRKAVQEAIQLGSPSGVIDLRHAFSLPLQRPPR